MNKFYCFLLLILLPYTAQTQCWQTVSAGMDHTVAIKPDGTLWAWGFNASGQLGDGSTIGKSQPTRIGTDSNWKTISAGANHTLAIKTDGMLWAWGNNLWGQVGDGSAGNQRNYLTKISSASNWKEVYAGNTFSLAIKSDGTLWAWGDNADGQLGQQSNNAYIPVQVGSSAEWKTASPGERHTLAVKTDGTLWSWGNNSQGQLGDGTTINKSVPIKIGSATDWKSVSASHDFSLAIKTDGTLWAWGDNSQGQLGDGTYLGKKEPVQIGTATWQSVSAGYNHSLALKTDGSLWAWGWIIGRFGYGNENTKNIPTQRGTGTNWQSIVCGYQQGFAFTTDGDLWAWGDNNWGKLGDGTEVDQPEPMRVLPKQPEGEPIQIFCQSATVADLKATGTNLVWFDSPTGGSALPAATPLVNEKIYYANQTNYACVSASRLEVKVAINTTLTPMPEGPVSQTFCLSGKIGDLAVAGTDVKWYLQAVGGLPLTSSTTLIDGAHYYASQTVNVCESRNRLKVIVTLLKSSAPTGPVSQTYCTGAKLSSLAVVGTEVKWYATPSGGTALPSSTVLNHATHYYASQTLNGCEALNRLDVVVSLIPNTTPPPSDPEPVPYEKIYASISCSGIIKSDGSLWGWGSNFNGALANGTQTEQTYPIPLVSSTKWRSIAIGEHFLAIKSDGTLWAWGDNGDGELGISDRRYNGTDVLQVNTDTDWQMVSAGTGISVAIKNNGTLWIWGEYIHGELGDNWATYGDRRTPKQLGSATNWKTVSAGMYHLLAIKNDGSLYSWGYNAYGQVGDGTNNDVYVPTSIGSSADWQAVSGSYSHSVAIKINGTLWAWGSNENGLLGNGATTGQSYVPVQVGSASDWKMAAAGLSHNLAVKTDGTLWAWGSNEFYQLGDGTKVSKSTPIQIGGDKDWISVAAGGSYSFALKSDGTLWAWGHNYMGQIGDGTYVGVSTPKKILSASQTHCKGARLTDVSVTGSNITWYATSTDGTPLASETFLTDKTFYYASQRIGSCESASRLRVAISIIPSQPLAPTGNAFQMCCYGATLANLTTEGSYIKWYAAPIGGMALPSSTRLMNGTQYYASQTVGTCESDARLAVTVNLPTSAIPAPTGVSVQTFCLEATVANLTAIGTGIKWYDMATGSLPLSAATALVDGKHYYASQAINSCESSARFEVVASLPVTSAPTGNTSQVFCEGATIQDLIANGAVIKWYSAITGGIPLAASALLENGSHYYATQTLNLCESSARLKITASINSTVHPSGNVRQVFCPGSRIADLTASGSSIRWYENATGGAPLSAATALVDGQHYYASQTINSCESSARMEVVVSLPVTLAPMGNVSQVFCEEATIKDLVANGTGIKWYSAATGGTPLPAATASVDGKHYYASQTINSCESSARLEVVVSISKVPAPSGNSSQVFCSGATIKDLIVDGTEIKWYATLTSIAELPISTSLANNTQYFATQTSVGCESNTRLVVSVAIHPVPGSPTGISPQVFTEGETISNLVVSGSGIAWYSSAEDAENRINVLPVSTVLEANVTYFATQTILNCESLSALPITTSVITGIEVDEQEFQCYPNPVKDYIHISSNQIIEHVTVENLLGQKVISKKIGSKNVQLNLGTVDNGIYLIQIQSNKRLKPLKVVKQ